MTTETITLNNFIYNTVCYRIQKYIIIEEFFDEEAGELDDYYNGQYEYDVQCLIETMKQHIDTLYNFEIDYECQGRDDVGNFVGSPYPVFDDTLYDFIGDRMTEEIYCLKFFDQAKENELK